jgi:hypothetical protein
MLQWFFPSLMPSIDTLVPSSSTLFTGLKLRYAQGAEL